MLPVILPAAISAGGAIAGGLLSKKPQDSSKDIYNDAKARVDAVHVPTVEEQKVNLQNLVQQGIITPQQAQAILQDPSALAQISVDPRFKQAQMDALSEYQRISDAGGLTATDKAGIQDITDNQNAEERGSREAILQNMRERGTSGSGYELAAMLEAQQGAANRAARSGTDVAAQAEARRMDAITKGGALAGEMGNTDYQRQADLAKAKDIISQFNTSNKQAVSNLNVVNNNAAQGSNLAEKQRVADANTNLTNANTVRNSDLIQTKYDNDIKKAIAPLGVMSSAAKNAQDVSNAQTTQANNILGTGLNSVGNVLSAFAQPKPAAPTSTALNNGTTTPVAGSDYEAQLKKMLGY